MSLFADDLPRPDQRQAVEIDLRQADAALGGERKEPDPVLVGDAPSASVLHDRPGTHAQDDQKGFNLALHSPIIDRLSKVSRLQNADRRPMAMECIPRQCVDMATENDTATELQAAFAERLRETRAARGFKTQIALSKALGGRTNDAVHTWEKGRSYPRPPELLALCKLLGVTSDYLLFGDTSGLTAETYRTLFADPKKVKR
jgi:ribosome-binding protein aMBF1 (putative translation factor)